MPLLIILPLPNISKNGRLAPLITIFIFQLQFAETQVFVEIFYILRYDGKDDMIHGEKTGEKEYETDREF